MNDSCKKLLQEIYDYDQDLSHTRPYLAIYDKENSAMLYKNVQRLISGGYIEQDSSSVAGGSLLILTDKGERFVENGFQIPNETPNVTTNNTFNVTNAQNAIIGSQSIATLNINNAINEAIQKIRDEIDSSASDDKEELHKMINLLEETLNNQNTINKGLFSKFIGILQRNAWVTNPIANAILKWLTNS